MQEKLEFHTSKIKMIKLLVMTLFITIVGVSCLDSDILIIDIIGFLNLIIGISGMIIGIYSLIDNSPQLILTDKGIEHKKVTKNTINWSDVFEAEIIKERGQQLLILKHKEITNLNDFKYIFRKTAESQLKRNIIKLNIGQLIIDYDKLNIFLNSKINYQTAVIS